MKKRVYIETSVISYLTARPSRDLIRAARQAITREWWEKRRQGFELFASQVVRDEAGDGDPGAAKLRLDALRGSPLLDVTGEVTALAEGLVTEGPLPEAATDDAFHLALATVYGIDFLLTWNCRHLANAELAEPLAAFLRARGYEPPVICTPEELMGEQPW
ncbi:MAG: type II toxin-antitoxin system VapC family toxin [Planctomycetes bacterium]|nr:type II toxin-antitoxin system VapC family toxin [Planctomycetota bacterium]